jgi:hypothetical protein
MRRFVLPVVGLLVVGCGAQPSNPAAIGTPSSLAAGKAGGGRFHPDMSRPLGHGGYCDPSYPLPTVRQLVGTVGKNIGNARTALLVRVVRMGAPRWNTPDGHRPTQAQADAMVDRLDITPSIYTPLTLSILRLYAGVSVSGELAAFAETGRIGLDEDFSCGFGSPHTLQIRDGPAVVAVGATYVAFLAKELVTGRNEGALSMPVIDNLFAVQGDRVLGLDGHLEPLPVGAVVQES